MKKNMKKKLTLNRETLLNLSPAHLRNVAGGLTAVGCWGSVPSETACGTSAACYTGGCATETATCGCDTTTNAH
ncbi:MAG TPA: class I lanthipeptide [Thermoanaerobaculia bacterium]|jgi:hypothetical protein|nr:class I lanthipeptide [Thermoanaerobaculia bacterium]